jgi:hypothetical protein
MLCNDHLTLTLLFCPPCDQPDVDIVRNAVDQPQYYEETYPSIQLAYVASLAGTR